jgi:hypothetical protein
MPTSRVQAPDGRVIPVEHPEGATPEQIISFAQRQSTAPTGARGLVSSIDEGLAGLKEQAGRGIERVLSGGDPQRTLAGQMGQFLNPVPGSIGEAALMVADPLIAVGPGGVLRKAITTSALHGANEATRPGSDLMSTAIALGLGGATGMGGGLLRNVATGGAANQRLAATWNAIMKYAGSDKLRDVVAPLRKNVFRFTEEQTVRSMKRAASEAIDKTWGKITEALPENHAVALRSVPPAQMNAVLKEARGTVKYVDSPQGPTPMISATDALAARNALKRSGDDLWHDVERDVLHSLPVDARDRFRDSLGAYFRDQRAIDHVAHLQDVRRLPSGINPTDMPGYIKAGAEDVKRGDQRGLYHLSMGLTHPSSPYGAVHLGEFAREALGGRGSAVGRYTPPSTARRVLGTAGAAATGEAGAVAQGALSGE